MREDKLREAIKALRETDKVQITGSYVSYKNPNCMCAIGVITEAFGNKVYDLNDDQENPHWGFYTPERELVINTVAEKDIKDRELAAYMCEYIFELNDDEHLSFAGIADKLEEKYLPSAGEQEGHGGG